jgi:hypothetical protein
MAYVVSFVPSEDSAEGFTEKLKNVSLVEADNDLRLRVNDKSYRFQPNVGQGKKRVRGSKADVRETHEAPFSKTLTVSQRPQYDFHIQ